MKRWICLVLTSILILCFTACDNVSSAKTGEDSFPVTETQKDALQTFLNDPTNNGFIGHDYISPEKISLYFVFYDGAGIGIVGTTDWSEQEKRDVLTAANWDSFHNPPLKLTRSAVDNLLREKIGLSQKEIEVDLNEYFCYVEAYDAYYAMHGDSNYSPVVVTAVTSDSNGTYVIEYKYDSLSEYSGVVTLRKTDTGFQFVSNIKK